MESAKQSYMVRFRKYVAELSKTHEYIAPFRIEDVQSAAFVSFISAHEVGDLNEKMCKTKKRTYEDTFGEREFDIERYGQEIDDTFFHTNIGHAVIG